MQYPGILYKQTLDWSNITYMAKKIKQRRFKKLDVLVSQAESISNIPKTMILIHKIKDELKMAKYLQLLLLESLHKKRDQIIQIFLSN